MEIKEISDKIFEGLDARYTLEDNFRDCHPELKDFEFSFDWYDGSVEIYYVPKEFRLNEESFKLFKEAGFCVVFVNHCERGTSRNNFWQTHYTLTKENTYKDYWRVNYKDQLCNDGEETPINIDEYFAKRK